MHEQTEMLDSFLITWVKTFFILLVPWILPLKITSISIYFSFILSKSFSIYPWTCFIIISIHEKLIPQKRLVLQYSDWPLGTAGRKASITVSASLMHPCAHQAAAGQPFWSLMGVFEGWWVNQARTLIIPPHLISYHSPLFLPSLSPPHCSLFLLPFSLFSSTPPLPLLLPPSIPFNWAVPVMGIRPGPPSLASQTTANN